MKRKIAPRKEEQEEQQFSNFKDRDERLAVKKQKEKKIDKEHWIKLFTTIDSLLKDE